MREEELDGVDGFFSNPRYGFSVHWKPFSIFKAPSNMLLFLVNLYLSRTHKTLRASYSLQVQKVFESVNFDIDPP